MSSDCDNCTTLSDADVASKETTDGALKVPGIQENRECGEEQVCGRLAIPIESQISRLLLRKLEEQCESYCILTGYDGLPDRFDTDIDFMVSTRDFSRIPALIDEIAAETGTRVFQMIPHEISGRAFRLAAESEGELAFIQPDSCSDYRHFGKLWLCADEVLATRRPHPSGFWIPGAACEFIYYLIKRVNKRDFTNVHGTKLSRLYQEDPQKSKSYLRRFWKERSAGALADMAAKNDWPSLIANMNEFRRELRRRSNLGAGLFRRALHALERVEQPTGGWVAFVGPDGCGKSTVIDAVAAEFGPAFQRVVRCHLRPKSLPARSSGEFPVTDPHGQPVRGRLYSMLKMLYLFSDYWLGYVTFVKRQTVRTKLVIFDRYFYDILIDPKRILYGGPMWLPKLLSKLVPRPELVMLLNASPEVLWSRKQEVGYEEIVRQRCEYLNLAHNTAGVAVIDAGKPLDEVVRQVRETMLDYFSRRTRRRLHLED